VEKQIFQHILIARTDRIGDVLLTLPSVEALQSKFQKSKVSMLVSPYTAPLLDGMTDVLLYTPEKHFFEMVNRIRSAHVDAALVMYPRFRVALLLWLAGIPIRVGTGYRWYSFLFNRKVYEHRKSVEKHEAEYNLSLARALGCTIPEKVKGQLILTDREKQTAQAVRSELGLTKKHALILLHPGSGGSARDWSPDHFASLAAEFSRLGYQVVITGGKTEEELVRYVAREAKNNVRFFVSTLSLKEFAAFIQTAKLFVANSTGPLHLAAAVGTPVIGFYPPVLAMSPKRWGPLTEKKAVFVPDPAQCPRCKGSACQGNDCMNQITEQHVIKAAKQLLPKRKII
jgi:heptosyltransferase III